MNTYEAVTLANRLLNEHGFNYIPITLTRGKRTLGIARFKGKKPAMLGLSKYLIQLNSVEIVKNTILHEIAHFIAGIDAKHNHTWKTVAKRIGCTGERCTSNAVMPEPKWLTVCGVCDDVLGKRHRRTSMLHNRYCKSCGKQSIGKLKQVLNREWIHSAVQKV
jgi:predicted SprT family Zn-dependent metalloprotease